MSASQGAVDRRVDLFYFGAGQNGAGQLLGCYHPPRAPARDCAVVLCHALGHEYIQFHRVLRQLAVLLADAGFPVLRFDLSGCGDSAGDHESWRVARWSDDVQAAVEELKRRGGASRIALAGLRSGGTLSLLVGAARGDVDALILWDPVVSGRAFLADLRAQHEQMLGYAHVLPEPAERGGSRAETLGFALPDALAADLGQVDALGLEGRPARRVLVIESNDSAQQAPLCASLASSGADVQHERFSNPHLWAWSEDFAKVHVPHKILKAAVSWMSEEYA